MRSKFIRFFAFSIACLFFVQASRGADHAMGVHGMVLFSDGKQLYGSHLPLLHPPHDYQIVLALRVNDPKLNNDLVSAARHNILTIEPERFDLLRLKNEPQIQSFQANVYDGHFERQGRKRLAATFNIDKVMLFEQVQKQALSEHRYFVLPQAQGSFLLHQIRGKGDFDQILETPIRDLPAQLTFKSALTLPSSDEKIIVSRLIWWETSDLLD